MSHPVLQSPLSARVTASSEDLKIRQSQDLGTAEKVEAYLRATLHRYEVGEPEYYGRLALEQAMLACREGNYGIGAVAILIRDGKVEEFRNRNAMVTGIGVSDHAESRVLVDALRWKTVFLDKRNLAPSELHRSELVHPVARYTTDLNASIAALARQLGEGLHVFGSLEPCQMCVAQIFNAGARTSWSIARDEFGGAVENGKFDKLPPIFPTLIREAGQTFGFISNADPDMVALSDKLFLHSRELIDAALAARANVARVTT